jgi:hypothetical protein
VADCEHPGQATMQIAGPDPLPHACAADAERAQLSVADPSLMTRGDPAEAKLAVCVNPLLTLVANFGHGASVTPDA